MLGHPGFYRFRALGSLQFLLEHSLVHLLIFEVVELFPVKSLFIFSLFVQVFILLYMYSIPFWMLTLGIKIILRQDFMDVLRVGIRSGKKPFFNLLFLVEIKNVPDVNW